MADTRGDKTSNRLIKRRGGAKRAKCKTLNTKIWFIKGVDNVNWPPYRDWKADVSSVSPSSEQIDLLWRRANARNVSFSISVRWSIYIINSFDKPNFRVSLPHRRSTTVSLETNPLYLILYYAAFLACLLAWKSSMVVITMVATQQNAIWFSISNCEVNLPSLFVFSEMWTET